MVLGRGACVVVAGVTPRHGAWESHVQGEGKQIFHIVRVREEHTVQDPTVLLTILGRMATKPEVKFDTLFPKLYNTDLWLLAYHQIAAHPGNITPGIAGPTLDGTRTHHLHAFIK